MVIKFSEESSDMKSDLVKLKLNIGLHEKLKEKLGVSCLWQELAHHHGAITKLTEGKGQRRQ